jgi:hypothetical protein
VLHRASWLSSQLGAQLLCFLTRAPSRAPASPAMELLPPCALSNPLRPCLVLLALALSSRGAQPRLSLVFFPVALAQVARCSQYTQSSRRSCPVTQTSSSPWSQAYVSSPRLYNPSCDAMHLWSLTSCLASRLFDETLKLIDCRRTAVVCGYLRHLRLHTRPAALYTSPSRIVVKPVEPRSSLHNLVEPRIPDVRQK